MSSLPCADNFASKVVAAFVSNAELFEIGARRGERLYNDRAVIDHFFLSASTAFQASSGGCCSYSSARDSVIPSGVEESLTHSGGTRETTRVIPEVYVRSFAPLRMTARGKLRQPHGFLVSRFVLFLLKHLNRVPGFVGRLLFVFERALQIHLGQKIVRIKFEKA